MLGTPRRTFGNIVGHAKGVTDLSSLSSWTAEQFDPRLSWADVEWIKQRWGGKLILKGILDVEDARLAADSGADALFVSHPGGPHLYGGMPSIPPPPPTPAPSTPRRTFGNSVGHAKGVTDLSSLSSWTAEQFDPRLSWADVEWIKQRWGGKLILKGILDVEDARLAADSGADALIVSNHGGRQLDGAMSSIAALPAIADAVGSRIEVWMDGGIRSGQDVLKAVALGARGTMIGRAFLYGLGDCGKAGVTSAREIR